MDRNKKKKKDLGSFFRNKPGKKEKEERSVRLLFRTVTVDKEVDCDGGWLVSGWRGERWKKKETLRRR